MSDNRAFELQLVARAQARAERLRRAANLLKQAADYVDDMPNQLGYESAVSKLRGLLDEVYPNG